MALTVSLGEGGTPLVPAPRLSERLGCDVWLKWEGANPTGSFKDRGMAVAVSRAVERGAPGVVCASTGNTAASAAAYAARAGLPAVIVLPAGAVARGKLAQAVAAGAELREVDGSFEDAHMLARRLAEVEGWVNVNSINPDRIEGQASAAREIAEQLGGVPDAVALPYGGGGNTCAYARGFAEIGGAMPRLLAVQPADRAGTFASAIRIADPVHRERAESVAEVVTAAEDEIAEWWRAVAQTEGLFCEPASAASLAGVARVRPEGRVVCVLTGTGLKDPDAVERL
ncbi:MAG TPA: threonine synthase [Gaiellaceae bacterium]|nr:threonine synthase [Gaiellaceae bacterium]